MSKKVSREKKEWKAFVSYRAAQIEGEYATGKRRSPVYKELSEASSELHEKIKASLPQNLQLTFADYSDMQTGITCCFVDAAYELGMKDAFMLMRKFIL